MQSVAGTGYLGLSLVSILRMESWFKRNEVPRKVLHGSIGIVTTVLYCSGIQCDQVTPVLIKMLIPIASIEVVRLSSPAVNDLYAKVVGPLMRPSERDGRVNGVIWYLVGLIFVFKIFPKDISLYSVYLLSWADLAASTVGRYVKNSPKIVGSKSLAGTLAAWLAGTLAGLVEYGYLIPAYSQYNDPKDIYFKGSGSQLYLFCALSGLIGALAELFPIIDDNLSIPIVSSIGIYALGYFL